MEVRGTLCSLIGVKNGSEIKVFLAHQMHNFFRQEDMQPPKIIV